ncbi:hypothetical protein GX586_15890 [bacterium]|nr:hypothetical protein [bacterium]
MKRHSSMFVITTIAFTCAGSALCALVEPNEIRQPGTQPNEAGSLESETKCSNCHAGYDSAVEPHFNWSGGMMANASRDPIFWATVAIAEQDFDGSGDLCIRCHSTPGWYANRSKPTDGSGLTAADAEGVSCDACHKMTNPDDSELLGVMNAPFIANDQATPATGYYGTGMLSLWGGSAKLGPYLDAAATHQFLQSQFHRSRDYCGSCHDVSNPAVGDLAHNNGTQPTADPVIASGTPGSPVTTKAAFTNFPYRYGIVERTFSEFKAGALSQTLVSNYTGLPAELRAGAIRDAYTNSLTALTGGNYADGSPRYFSCQTCHVPPRTGYGCNKSVAPLRRDLPLHDQTGGNYWAADAIVYQNANGLLRLGSGLTVVQTQALAAAKGRARRQLGMAASLWLNGTTLTVVNLTGHKLISGYPEGRRMWINMKWHDGGGMLLREDGAYGTMTAYTNGIAISVRSLLDLSGTNTRIYEAHYAMTKEWAAQLVALGYPTNLPLSFDRVTGAVTQRLGDLAAAATGTHAETFHFVLNNHVGKDNRIPPYGFSYNEARRRNALPVPASQYGNPGAGGAYRHWDELALNPPPGAARADISLLYQPTSWEYVQFLYLANNRSNAFLANEGVNMVRTWLATGMAEPYVMATATWHGAAGPAVASNTVWLVLPPSASTAVVGQSIAFLSASLSNGIAQYGFGRTSNNVGWTWLAAGPTNAAGGYGATNLLRFMSGNWHIAARWIRDGGVTTNYGWNAAGQINRSALDAAERACLVTSSVYSTIWSFGYPDHTAPTQDMSASNSRITIAQGLVSNIPGNGLLGVHGFPAARSAASNVTFTSLRLGRQNMGFYCMLRAAQHGVVTVEVQYAEGGGSWVDWIGGIALAETDAWQVAGGSEASFGALEALSFRIIAYGQAGGGIEIGETQISALVPEPAAMLALAAAFMTARHRRFRHSLPRG